MFQEFAYQSVPLSAISLDPKNPRIVTTKKLKTEDAIIEYFFEHENLLDFIKKIAAEGRNPGAERPYLIKEGKGYTVIEGNTRIASYKILTGLLKPPAQYTAQIPQASEELIASLKEIECSIAPSRDAMLAIMASAHFGNGDKSKWSYLGSRKIVYEEYTSGRTIKQLSIAFNESVAFIKDLILEYKLYIEATKLDWTSSERQELLNPAVAFNPPVRFLQGSGHKTQMGIKYDRANLEIVFTGADSKQKFKHLIKKLVINPERGLGATASYADVFSDYQPAPKAITAKLSSSKDGSADGRGPVRPANLGSGQNALSSHIPNDTNHDAGSSSSGNLSNTDKESSKQPKKGALFMYPATTGNALQIQLMKEASEINSSKFPAAATALLRCIIESILKGIVDKNEANPSNNLLSLEKALDICLSNSVALSQDDKRILKEFRKSHMDYINLGAHATVIPNSTRLFAARDCIDQFVMRNI
ncbi:hypothetical protein [Brucella sp. IR073]|uniref:hypothetical protein n=1 Tax=unclassified Brucella TaxID=2632610 RepID=UPI003B97E3D4